MTTRMRWRRRDSLRSISSTASRPDGRLRIHAWRVDSRGLGLVPFRSTRGRYAVYADIAETEALLFRLNPIRVARWLEARGFDIGEWHDPRSGRAVAVRGA